MTTIESLHSVYGNMTGYRLALDMAREHEWYQWVRRGFTEEDLRLVIRHIQNGIRNRNRRPGALKFSNLIVSADLFEEDLAEARACARVPKVNPNKAQVLRATGRVEETSGTARSAAEILDSPGFKALQEFRKQLEYAPRKEP